MKSRHCTKGARDPLDAVGPAGFSSTTHHAPAASLPPTCAHYVRRADIYDTRGARSIRADLGSGALGSRWATGPHAGYLDGSPLPTRLDQHSEAGGQLSGRDFTPQN